MRNDWHDKEDLYILSSQYRLRDYNCDDESGWTTVAILGLNKWSCGIDQQLDGEIGRGAWAIGEPR